MSRVSKRLAVFIFASATFCALLPLASAQGPVILPATLREDFQGDGLGQWASYPPAQDIGYEPSITPTSEFGAPGGRALMRWVQPTRAGDVKLGVIKQVNLVSSADGRLRFAYRMNAPVERIRIELGIAGTDGSRYVRIIPAVTNQWITGSVALSEFRREGSGALASGTGIEAVYAIAHIEGAAKDTIYRFLIDNIEFSAAGKAAFAVLTPQADSVEPWAEDISAASFQTGDVFPIKARSPVDLSRANVVFRDPSGRTIATAQLYDNGTHGDAKSNDNLWTNNAAYRFTAADAVGIWRAEFNGSDPGGRTIATPMRFLAVHNKRQQHPRLYFDAGNKEKLVARMRDPRLAKVWEYIQNTAKNTRATGNLAHGGDVFQLLDKEYLLPSLLGYFDVLNRARSRIAYNAFLAYLTNDAEARVAAKDALLAVTRWHRWEPPWFTAHGQHTYYPAGLLAVDAALGYDLLYNDLTESERSQIRRALIEKQIEPTYREYFLDNRAMTNTSNWISHTVGGALIAASAIAGDVTTEESKGKFYLYVNGLLMKIEAHMSASYLPDGSYGEGISYLEFDMETLAPMLNAVETAFGVDYWNTTHIKDSLRYPLYNLTVPPEASPDMGDTHPPAGHGIAPLIYRSKDPVMRWYYSRFDRPSLTQFIFFDDSVKPKSPAEAGLPTSTIFNDKGNAVFRTGWGEDSITMLFRAGPNFNHHHADQGSFLITAFGEALVTEAGWSDYYKDPYYATFFTQAEGHNTVLVDGNPESQTIPDTPQFKALNKYPRITDSITSEFYDGVGSELSTVYNGRLEGYARRIVFVKPFYFVVFDDIAARGPAVKTNFLLHLPDRKAVTTSGSTALYKGKKASLGVRWFTPPSGELRVKDGRIPYHIFSARTPAETPLAPAYLDFANTQPSKNTNFLAAVVPAKTSGETSALMRQMFPVTGENVSGIRVERESATDLVMFRTSAENTLIREGEWSANASVMTVTQKGSDIQMLAAHDARSVTKGKRVMFSADTPTSIAVNYGSDQIDTVSNSDAATKLVLFVGTKPTRILLDGNALHPGTYRFSTADGTLSLNIPAGRHEIRTVLK